MKVSILTVCFNSEDTIRATIESVLSQTYKDIEYIIVDGASTDNTISIIKSYSHQIAQFVSEPDNGLYDAMNKAIELASGDVVGILNSDDLYIDELVIQKIVDIFASVETDSVFGDLVYVKRSNTDKVVRFYDSSFFDPSKFAYGLMPAHPTFFVNRECYTSLGVYRTNLKVAADFDLLLRFLLVHSISYVYLNKVLVKMRMGGVSTHPKSLMRNSFEILSVCRDQNIKTNIFKILSRYFIKFASFFVFKSY